MSEKNEKDKEIADLKRQLAQTQMRQPQKRVVRTIDNGVVELACKMLLTTPTGNFSVLEVQQVVGLLQAAPTEEIPIEQPTKLKEVKAG